MRGSRKFSKWESSFLVKLNVRYGQIMFYCTDNSMLINIYICDLPLTVKHMVCPYETGFSHHTKNLGGYRAADQPFVFT